MRWRAFSIAAAALAVLLSFVTKAADYPARNSRLIIPFAPGGTNDVVARLVAQHLTERWGKSFIAENRTGAGGVLANDIVAKANADGHTLLVTNPSLPMAAGLFKTLPYDTLRDFSPVTEIMRAPSVLVINPGLKITTLADYIAHARANPGRLNYGSGGFGSSLHLYSELFNKAAGVKITHVPFKGGGENMTALLSGQVHMNIIQYQANVLEFVRNGRLRALAVTTEGKRSKSLPDTPSFAEAGVNGMAIYTWIGILGPAKLAPAITRALQGEVVRLVKVPAVIERFSGQDAEMIASEPAAFGELVHHEVKLWTDVIRSAGITPQ